PHVDPRAPIATSYQELSAGQPVTQRLAWLVLSLDPSLCPVAVAARADGVLGAQRALASLAARLVVALAPHVQARVLGPDQIRSVLATAIGDPVVGERVVGEAGGNDATDSFAEEWGQVASARAIHRSYRLHLGAADNPDALLGELSQVPCLGSTLSVAIVHDARGEDEMRVVLRTTSLPEDAEGVDGEIQAVARRHRTSAYPLDGEQAIALAETLPICVRGWRHQPTPHASPSWFDPRVPELQLPIGRCGLAIGRRIGNAGEFGDPLSVQLFADRPCAVSAMLDPGVALVLCYRALAVGARIHVISTRAEHWVPLRRLAVDDPGTVILSATESPLLEDPGAVRAMHPHAARPLLVVVDQASLRSPVRIAPQPWQCVLTLLPELSLGWLPSTRSANLVVTQRLARPDAIAAGPFLGIASADSEVLSGLSDEQVGIVERGRLTVANLAITISESQLLVAATSAQGG
ncbi:MAG: type VII secretion protein EccE, partial [Nocardioides sp.]